MTKAVSPFDLVAAPVPAAAEAGSAASSILILYTTLYREGGAQFRRAAATLARQKQREFPGRAVVCRAVESKRDFVAAFAALAAQGGRVAEFHFIGHSGVYGIMFGTRAWPEQFSPFEWKNLALPFAPGAKAYIHACRSGRWFAPFLARTFQITVHGYHWYTTISQRPDKYVRETDGAEDLYVISCVGKKSHGLAGTLAKRCGLGKTYPFKEFHPSTGRIDTTYDAVADLYDETFGDIAVRGDEVRWLMRQLGDAARFRVLDIGCGNGAFLAKLAPGIREGVGVDISAQMLQRARERNAGRAHLSFVKVDGPALPFPDDSFDRVVSMLSFRYLDWDPVVKEILRVLKPGGEFLVVDMVAAPVKLREMPFFLRCKARAYRQRLVRRGFFKSLARMVKDPRWQTMLAHNPIRSEHEMRWYLESRFKPAKAQIVNIGWSSRILAFRSGAVGAKTVAEMTFP